MNRVRLVSVALVSAFAWATVPQALAEDNGVVKGRIAFKGNVGDFKRSVIDTSKDGNCKKSKSKIGSYRVILNKKTDPVTVRNVMVYVKKGLEGRTYDAPTEPVVLTQKGCEYNPHVFGVMEGQTLAVRNGDDTNHNIHLLPKINQELNFSQPKKGMEKELKLEAEETFKLKCDVHPWMGAYVQVFTHPFFDVTGKKGTFELKGLPAGEYEIEAWHETFGTQTMTVTVTPGEPTTADFTYEP